MDQIATKLGVLNEDEVKPIEDECAAEVAASFKRNEAGREDPKGTIRTWPARERDGWIEGDRDQT